MSAEPRRPFVTLRFMCEGGTAQPLVESVDEEHCGPQRSSFR